MIHNPVSKSDCLASMEKILGQWSRIRAPRNDYQLSIEAMNDHAAFKKEYETSLSQKKSKAKAYFEAYMSVFEQAQDLVLSLLEPFCIKYGERVLDLQAIDSHEVVPILPKQTIIDSRNRPKTLTGQNGISAAGCKIVQWFNCLNSHDESGRDIRDRRRTLEWLHNLVLVDGPEFRLMIEPLEWVQTVFSRVATEPKILSVDLAEGPQPNGDFVCDGKRAKMSKGMMCSLLEVLWKAENHTVDDEQLAKSVWNDQMLEIPRLFGGLRDRTNRFFEKNNFPYFVESRTVAAQLRVSLVSTKSAA